MVSFVEIVSYAMGEGAGYDEGYKAGEESSTAYQDGYNAGETDGYATGYEHGYEEGYGAFTEYIRSYKGTLSYLFAKTNASNNNVPAFITNEQLKKMLRFNIKNYCNDKNDASFMFLNQYLLTEIPEFDISGYTNLTCLFGAVSNNGYCAIFNRGGTPPLLDTSEARYINFMFAGAYRNSDDLSYNNMIAVPLYDFRKVNNARGLFFKCKQLKEIPAFNFYSISSTTYNFSYANSQSTDDWLSGCSNLERIHIVDIHYNFNISQSEVTKLDRDALVEIIGNLRDMTGSSAKTLTMGATNMAKLTDEDIAVATAKNWTVA